MREKKDYEVGYGKPPVHSRFPKGKSGNSRGRPRKTKNVDEMMDLALNQRIPVYQGDKRKMVTLREVLVTQQINLAAKGNQAALDRVFAFDRTRVAPDEFETDLDGKAALDAYVSLQQETKGDSRESGDTCD